MYAKHVRSLNCEALIRGNVFNLDELKLAGRFLAQIHPVAQHRPKHLKYVGGGVHRVNTYYEEDLPFMHQALQMVANLQPPGLHAPAFHLH
jgi:hypothetical protein